MGLLDSVLAQVSGGGAAAHQSQLGRINDPGALAGVLGELFGQGNGTGSAGGMGGMTGVGGLGGLVSRFEQAGLGNVISSWIGKGDNAPVSGDQLHRALGDDTVSSMASKLGVNISTLLPMLAALLPSLVDRLTPHGQIPPGGQTVAPDTGGAAGDGSDLLSSLSHLLQKD